MIKISRGAAKALLNGSGVKELFDNGFLYVFSGPVPDSADAALDMVSMHTQIVKISNNNTATGLTFDVPTGAVLGKTTGETWSGEIDMSGAHAGQSELAPTFYRFCAPGDDGRGASTDNMPRIQGTAGGPNSGADLQFGAPMLQSGQTQPVGSFTLMFE